MSLSGENFMAIGRGQNHFEDDWKNIGMVFEILHQNTFKRILNQECYILNYAADTEFLWSRIEFQISVSKN